jgi:hypothetical protein
VFVFCLIFCVVHLRVVAYLSRVLEVAFTALEGLNKQSFLTELVTYFQVFDQLIPQYMQVHFNYNTWMLSD